MMSMFWRCGVWPGGGSFDMGVALSVICIMGVVVLVGGVWFEWCLCCGAEMSVICGCGLKVFFYMGVVLGGVCDVGMVLLVGEVWCGWCLCFGDVTCGCGLVLWWSMCYGCDIRWSLYCGHGFIGGWSLVWVVSFL